MSVAVVRRKIQQIATQVIGREIGLDEPLMDAGLDSLGGQEMKAQIEDEFAVELPATAAFDYPTVSVLGISSQGNWAPAMLMKMKTQRKALESQSQTFNRAYYKLPVK